MKTIFIFFLLVICWNSILSQSNSNTLRLAFVAEYNALYNATFVNDIGVNQQNIAYGYVNSAANDLRDILYAMEALTYYGEDVSANTKRLITYVREPYVLVMLERSIKEDLSNDNGIGTNYQFKKKLLAEISKELTLNMQANYPYYVYEVEKKKVVKFISIRTGNDLFTPTGIVGEFYTKDYYVPDDLVFQRNDDRDYTGSFLLEIGTDYFNVLRRRPLKSYQTVFYGFDVYTPYFRSNMIFNTDTSFNIRDRPHASFQYFGWSKKGLSKFNHYRWSNTIKFGRIGGKTGETFQNALHQDISYSPRPKGWGAQIARGGRIGFSYEAMEEFQFYDYNRANTNSFRNIHTSVFGIEQIGTFMTTLGLGLQFSNKSFLQTNHNYINHRTRQGVYSWADHIMYNIAFTGTYVFHNTMLEGFGIVSTTEHKNDQYTPKSLYYLKYDQVRRVTGMLNITLGYTTRFATLFYNWKSFSPETKLQGIGINSYSGNEMTIGTRWHHFAEIGLSFNIH